MKHNFNSLQCKLTFYPQCSFILPFGAKKYWVGQKFHLDFSIRYYERPEQTLWPNQYIPTMIVLRETPYFEEDEEM